MGEAVTLVVLYVFLAVTNFSFVPCLVDSGAAGRKAQLTSRALLKILKPCIWSRVGTHSAMLNRLCAATTLRLCLPLQGVRHRVAAVPREGEHKYTALARLQQGEVFRYSV